MYLVSRTIAYPVPFAEQIWLVGASTVVALAHIPGRCSSDIDFVPGFKECSIAWANELPHLNYLWPFSLPGKPGFESPKEACIKLQTLLIVSAHAGIACHISYILGEDVSFSRR